MKCISILINKHDNDRL